MSHYLEKLNRSGLSLIIYREEEVIFSSAGKGLNPIMEAVEKIGRNSLCHTIVSDKTVGKAAALVMAYFKASEVHAGLLSISAKGVLLKHGIIFDYFKEVPAIQDRSGINLCPFERLVIKISDPVKAYNKIRSFLGS